MLQLAVRTTLLGLMKLLHNVVLLIQFMEPRGYFCLLVGEAAALTFHSDLSGRLTLDPVSTAWWQLITWWLHSPRLNHGLYHISWQRDEISELLSPPAHRSELRT